MIHLKPVNSREKLAQVGLAFTVFMNVAATIISFWQLSVLYNYMDGSATMMDLDASDTFAINWGIGSILVAIVAIVLICMWLHRVTANLHAIPLPNLEFTPGWAVGWYFIPIANLWMPFKSMTEIWKGSVWMHGQGTGAHWTSTRLPSLVGMWWGTWIVSGIISRIEAFGLREADSVEDFEKFFSVGAVATAISLISAIFLFIIIRRVSYMQKNPQFNPGDILQEGLVPETYTPAGFRPGDAIPEMPQSTTMTTPSSNAFSVPSPAGGGEITLHHYTAKTITGEDFPLVQLRGKKVLIVNTASECGLTPQYRQLQELYEAKGGDLFEIIAFPCNDFGAQEPGSHETIKAFCETNYGVTFPLMEKVHVKGDTIHPIYYWLTRKDLNGKFDAEVTWNFQKFMIDVEGQLVDYASPETPVMDEKILSWLES